MTQIFFFCIIYIMKKTFFYINIVASLIILHSQISSIVHIDSSQDSKAKRFSQTASLAFNFLDGNTQELSFQPKYYISYRLGSTLKKEWFFIATKQYSKNQQTITQDNSFIHLRYTAYTNTKNHYEYFFQNESNRFTDLSRRWLIGSSYGIDIHNQNNHYYTIKLGLMLEDETQLNSNQSQLIRITQSHHYKFNINNDFTLFLTSYFQPSFNDWSDIRTSLHSTFQWKIFTPLNYSISLSADYDSRANLQIKPYDIAIKQYLSYQY
jgi:hypothetical protein